VYKNLEIIPSATNRFAKTDKAVCYLEIYEPLMTSVSVPQPKEEGAGDAKAADAQKTEGPKIGLQLRVIDRKSGDTKGDSGLVEVTSAARPGNPVVPIALNLPVDKLEAGTYRAELKAVDSAGRAVTRVVDFEVL